MGVTGQHEVLMVGLYTCDPAKVFFLPTPSWLPPGRYTRSIAAKRWIVIIMQGCLLVDSHKSTGSGPVRSPVSCPIKKTKNTNQKQKQPSKQNTHNHNQTKPNKTKHREVGSLPAMRVTCTMTSCVSLWVWPPKKKQNQENTEPHKGARQEGDSSNKAQCGNQGSPQPGSPRSQRAAVQA